VLQAKCCNTFKIVFLDLDFRVRKEKERVKHKIEKTWKNSFKEIFCSSVVFLAPKATCQQGVAW